ncbi:unnamed protein product, partial [Cuscuta europaea]
MGTFATDRDHIRKCYAHVKGISSPLNRAFSNVSASELQIPDIARRARKMPAGVVQFTVQGTYAPFLAGLHYTRFLLGSPPLEFRVQIDTDSEISWVSCASCNGCPLSSGFLFHLQFFNPQGSSTSSFIPCSDHRCASHNPGCSSSNNLCKYNITYGDGGETAGYYIADNIHLDMINGNKYASSVIPIVFGCSTYQLGYFAQSNLALDGIFGFNRNKMSIISQLSSEGVISKVFSHCLKEGEGSFFVLGEAIGLNLMWTPLAPH